MTDYGRILLASLGSFLLLGGALFSQFVGGLPPCQMCIWQRWPHLAAIVIGLVAITIGWRFRGVLAIFGGIAASATAAIGFFHAGVEQGWWEGPSTCSAGDVSQMSTEEAFAQMLQTPLVRCDEILWQFGLSLAGWNGVISLGLAGLWFWTVYQPFSLPQPQSSD
ncbi:MAG: disulfide bond formation protein B [Pseudomonadota bacterium]